MADRLFFSCWMRGYTEHNMLARFEKVLRAFPFSSLSPEAIVRVYAVEIAEPPQMEHLLEELDVASMMVAFREFENADAAYQVDTSWDLWQPEDDWSLQPSAVLFTLYGPLAESELGEQIRVEFGLDSQFLPDAQAGTSLTPVRSNIRSLLRFVEDVRKAVPVEKLTLWSESGESLAGRLEEAIAGDRII